ncbi:MAG: S49 family peptidase, partial [Sphingomonadales bacterium]|nr:S49 family peptidase [Sphingomonadales bacterium]
DLLRGPSPEASQLLQMGVEGTYRRFIMLVANARHLPPARVNEIAQGRVWDGGTAHQLGLVDRFGSLDDAVAEAAKRAGIDAKNVRRVYLEKQPGWFAQLVQGFADNDDDDASTTGDTKAGDLFAMLAAQRQDVLARALGDARRLATVKSVQARCLECAGFSDARADDDDRTLAQTLIKAIWQ